MGDIVKLVRELNPPELQPCGPYHNLPRIELECDGVRLTLELPEDSAKIRHGITRLMVELMEITVHEGEDSGPEERRRYLREMKRRMRTGALPSGLVRAMAANPQAPSAVDLAQAYWYLWMPPAKLPDSAA